MGWPGEMFTSAAPQDPIFWPLHGPAERFVQWLRVWKGKGLVEFDETWSYTHVDAASDTHVVCDWSEVEGLELPKCAKGTCPGHKSSDILPFTNLLGELDQVCRSFVNTQMMMPHVISISTPTRSS